MFDTYPTPILHGSVTFFVRNGSLISINMKNVMEKHGIIVPEEKVEKNEIYRMR
jgi:hypothetical protein